MEMGKSQGESAESWFSSKLKVQSSKLKYKG